MLRYFRLRPTVNTIIGNINTFPLSAVCVLRHNYMGQLGDTNRLLIPHVQNEYRRMRLYLFLIYGFGIFPPEEFRLP